ncbi:hypothetical protein Tco_1348315, partial [Tanacetum coccineum]
GEREEDINSILNKFNFKMSKIMNDNGEQRESENGGGHKPSFATVVNGAIEVRSTPKLNFRAMVNPDKVEHSDFILPIAAINAVKHKFDNTLVGFFVGKKVAFLLVKNYVMNTWNKFGFEKAMCDDDGVFYFKFTSSNGLEQVLEQGPWLIRNTPLILTKWTPNMSISKDQVTKVPVWVKLHKVSIVAFSEDGLSLIVTQVRTPIMLDAVTSAMCIEAWGRVGYARALIEISADKELKKEVIMVIPQVVDEVVTHTLENIRVEYEWQPHICLDCHVFGHSNDQCPKRIPEKVSSAAEKNPMYQPVQKPGANATSTGDKSLSGERSNGVKLQNLFKKLNEITTIVEPEITSIKGTSVKGKAGTIEEPTIHVEKECDDSDTKVEEVFTEENPSMSKPKGASTPYDNLGLDVEWGFMLSWVSYYFGVKCGYCNRQAERRALWMELRAHKITVCGFPWILMGDFNVALNMEDTYAGSSSMNSAMCEFKDCVSDIEIMDVTSSGIHFTWNQKPKGGGGSLKSLILLKKPLRKLLRDQGNLHERVNSLRIELDMVQKAVDSNPDDPFLREEACAYVQAFNEAILDEERFLKQKSQSGMASGG